MGAYEFHDPYYPDSDDEPSNIIHILAAIPKEEAKDHPHEYASYFVPKDQIVFKIKHTIENKE